MRLLRLSIITYRHRILKMMFFLLLVGIAVAAPPEFDSEFKRLALQNPDLYDGDMIGIDGPFDVERNAIPGENYRWPGGVVPYVIDDSIKDNHEPVLEAFKNYHAYTCVKFVPRTSERDYVRIFKGQGCYSNVGRTGGQQTVSLGDGCMYVGTAIHELGHAVGFYHEQNRSDRDDYLIIYIENVQKGMEFNFHKLHHKQNLLLTEFDYGSIMIYGNNAFSKDGSDTMVAKTGQKLLNPYDKQTMTESDVQRVKKMYNC